MAMAFAGTAAIALAVSVCVFTGLWLLSIKLRDVSIVDILWGPACALPAWVALYVSGTAEPRQLLLVAMVSLWALRLAWHVGSRNLGHGEDPRYTRMRQRVKPGQSFNAYSFKFVFMLQAVLSWLISWPVQVGQLQGAVHTLGLLAAIGVAVWFIGLLFEMIGDWQLKRFKQDSSNKGKLMDRGLWSWTRHPNYFGDSLVWFGLAIVALEAPLGWLGVFSPLLMLHFLLNLSGKKLLEKSMRRRYDDYADYEARVSGFFPLPPRKSNS